MVLVAALFAFVPFVSNLFTGLRSVEPATLELLRSVDASRWEVLVRLRLPQCLPNLFAAARICVGLALVGATVGEWLGGATGGLGVQIRTAQARTLIDQLWGSIVTLAVMGVACTLLVGALERVLLRWHSSQTH